MNNVLERTYCYAPIVDSCVKGNTLMTVLEYLGRLCMD